jgi:hypothetical protein
VRLHETRIADAIICRSYSHIAAGLCTMMHKMTRTSTPDSRAAVSMDDLIRAISLSESWNFINLELVAHRSEYFCHWLGSGKFDAGPWYSVSPPPPSVPPVVPGIVSGGAVEGPPPPTGPLMTSPIFRSWEMPPFRTCSASTDAPRLFATSLRLKTTPPFLVGRLMTWPTWSASGLVAWIGE